MSETKAFKQRRQFIALATTGALCSASANASIFDLFLGRWRPSDKDINPPITVDLATIEPGQMTVQHWRGKPIAIVHRTQKMLASLDLAQDKLLDPFSDTPDQPAFSRNKYRTTEGKEKFLIVYLVCTHLGCIVNFIPEDGAAKVGNSTGQQGFLCPCHGSRYDASGRVYKGSRALKNLGIPPYRYDSNTMITIGE